MFLVKIVSIVYITTLPFALLMITSSTGQSQDQSFTSQPQDVTVNAGRTAVLSCSVANLVGKVLWLRGGFGLGPGPTFPGFPRYRVDVDQAKGQYNLVINNTQLQDDNDFQCQVGATDSTPGMQSSIGHLHVQLPPQSITIGDGRSIIEMLVNTTSNVTCVAVGSRPAATVTWTQTSSLHLSPQVTEVTSEVNGKLWDVTSTVLVDAQLAVDGATIRCEASNIATSTPLAKSVKISVVYPPQVTIAVTPNVDISELDRVVFSCTAVANPPVTDWQWYLGGDVLSGERSSSLVLARISRQYNDVPVSCVATNSVGSTRRSITVIVKYGPQFIGADSSKLFADLGATQVVLTCPSVDSNPPAAITWTGPDGNAQPLSRKSELTISPVTPSSFGLYTCTASVPGFPSVSQTIQLLMNGPPTVTGSDPLSASFIGIISVNCTASSTSTISSFVWLQNGTNVNLNVSRYSVVNNLTADGTAWRSRLLISNVQDGDFGAYTCTATNQFGSASWTIPVSKQTTAPSILAVLSTVPVNSILAGVIPTVVVIVIVIVAACVCYRYRSAGSEHGSESSECHMAKHVIVPDAKMDVTVPNEHYQVAPPDETSRSFRRSPQMSEPYSGSYNVRSLVRSDYPNRFDLWGRNEMQGDVQLTNVSLPSSSISGDSPDGYVYRSFPLRPNISDDEFLAGGSDQGYHSSDYVPPPPRSRVNSPVDPDQFYVSATVPGGLVSRLATNV